VTLYFFVFSFCWWKKKKHQTSKEKIKRHIKYHAPATTYKCRSFAVSRPNAPKTISNEVKTHQKFIHQLKRHVTMYISTHVRHLYGKSVQIFDLVSRPIKIDQRKENSVFPGTSYRKPTAECRKKYKGASID
jgi:hypothetical protein